MIIILYMYTCASIGTLSYIEKCYVYIG